MLAIYIILCFGLMVAGFLWSKRKIFNPVTIFNAVWLIIVLMYQMQLSRLQRPLSDGTYLVLCINAIAFSSGFFLVTTIMRMLRKRTARLKQESRKIADIRVPLGVIKKLLLMWVVVEIVEVVVSGGIPVLWKIFGYDKTYMSFGIPTVHGLMNALGLVIITVSFYEYLKRTKKKEKRFLIGVVLVMLAYYLLLITRQVVISAIIQMAAVYFISRRGMIGKKKTIQIALCVILGIVAFGLIGTFRTGYDSFVSVSALDVGLPSFLIGFYWVYMYLTMTLANINNAVVLGISGFGGLSGAIRHFLPSVIENRLSNVVEVPQYLVTNAYNVSGYFISFYTGMGNIGVVLIAVIYGVVGAVIYEAFKKKETERNVILYAVYVQIIALSFFANHLLYLPSGFQLIIIIVLFRFLGLKKQVHNGEKLVETSGGGA